MAARDMYYAVTLCPGMQMHFSAVYLCLRIREARDSSAARYRPEEFPMKNR